ncbi:S9 family peptidase [Fontivita pretiosa]|uniref:S9 family peptidase n=1 Tax=Fontivita pretiosa TaxID=2989684 RepID=UPI003D166462
MPPALSRLQVLKITLIVVLVVVPAAAQHELIPRQVLFADPDRSLVRLSPDGRYISYLARHEGVLNIWIAPVDALSAARPITADRTRGIHNYRWAYTNEHIVYVQDETGQGNFNVHVVDLLGGKDTNLTPNRALNARIKHLSPADPEHVLVAMNDRLASFYDLWRINLRTGQQLPVLLNPGAIEQALVDDFVVDEQMQPRLAICLANDGQQVIFQLGPHKAGNDPAGNAPAPRRFASIPPEDLLSSSPEHFDSSGTTLYFIDSRGTDTAVLKAIDLTNGQERVLAEDSRCDPAALLVHPASKHVQAVEFEYQRPFWKVVDPAIEADLAYLQDVAPGHVTVPSRSLDDRLWLVAYVRDDAATRYYLYDRSARTTQLLFSSRPALDGRRLAKMRPRMIRARDGLELVCYLTVPIQSDGDDDGLPDRPLPMVLLVHDGPWSRDRWGLNPLHQWLANRGYAVLSVNYRGSTGLGKALANAGDRQWGGRMHEDLIDAVQAMIHARVADPHRIAIMGGGYGGYAALVGLSFTPEVFACGVDLFGPPSLRSLLESIPPYWQPARALWARRVGDPATPAGKLFLESRSPLERASAIRRPLLIAQGGKDQRVKPADIQQLLGNLQARQVPVTCALYPDERHALDRPQNRMSFLAITEAFLARHLGGRQEPIGLDLDGSSLQLSAGAEHIPGLAEAFSKINGSR